MVFVHQFAAGQRCDLGFTAQVNMYFAAGAAGAGIPHLPEIIFLIAIHDMVFRHQFFPLLQCNF